MIISYQELVRTFLSEPRLNISISALLFFVPNKSVNHACIGGGSLLYQVGQVQIFERSILRDAVQANQIRRLDFVVAQAAGVAGFIATAQQKFKHRTGYTQPLLISTPVAASRLNRRYVFLSHSCFVTI